MPRVWMFVFIAVCCSWARAEDATVKLQSAQTQEKSRVGEGPSNLPDQLTRPPKQTGSRASVSQQSKSKAITDKKTNVLGKPPVLGLCDGS